MTTNKVQAYLTVLIIFLIALIMGELSFEDEQIEQSRYCQRITNGMPAYNERINCDILNK